MISGNIVDVFNSRIFPGVLKIEKGRITDIIETGEKYSNYLIPGFVDSHIHIESSMLTPAEFSRAALIHGTVATVSDPHEIANVMGISGIMYMLENAGAVPLKFYFSAPSCVPFEKGDGDIDIRDVETLMKFNRIKCLGEVMNVFGVLSGDADLLQKINVTRKYGKIIDGHAPGLSGDSLKKYAAAGISTDHECFTAAEAIEKIKNGIKILIREGSAARNFDALYPLIDEHYDNCMFCSDDKHPDDLVKGHIDMMVREAVKRGADLFKVLKAASVNPVLHYNLEVGLLRKGDCADFLEVADLSGFEVLRTFIDGKQVYEKGGEAIPRVHIKVINNFHARRKKDEDFFIAAQNGKNINVIEAIEGQLITGAIKRAPKIKNGNAVSDVENDILKIAVVNRRTDEKPAIGFIKNFGIIRGAIASSVAHDSHNIIAVGASDELIRRAVNLIIERNGGISAVSDSDELLLPLEIGGIMSGGDYRDVSRKYTEIDEFARTLGTGLKSPFMTLSFMALTVIPKLKINSGGLFDGETFRPAELFCD